MTPAIRISSRPESVCTVAVMNMVMPPQVFCKVCGEEEVVDIRGSAVAVAVLVDEWMYKKKGNTDGKPKPGNGKGVSRRSPGGANGECVFRKGKRKGIRGGVVIEGMEAVVMVMPPQVFPKFMCHPSRKIPAFLI